MISHDVRWLAAAGSVDGERAKEYAQLVVGEAATATLLCQAVALVEKRNADLAASGQQEWAGSTLLLVIDEPDQLAPDLLRVADHIRRYGRKAGITVASSAEASA